MSNYVWWRIAIAVLCFLLLSLAVLFQSRAAQRSLTHQPIRDRGIYIQQVEAGSRGTVSLQAFHEQYPKQAYVASVFGEEEDLIKLAVLFYDPRPNGNYGIAVMVQPGQFSTLYLGITQDSAQYYAQDPITLHDNTIFFSCTDLASQEVKPYTIRYQEGWVEEGHTPLVLLGQYSS